MAEPETGTPRPWWTRELRFVLRTVLISIPIGIFMWVLWGKTWRDFAIVYETTLVLGFTAGVFIRANEAWVVPRLPKAGAEGARAPLVLQIASFAASSFLAAVVAATIANATFLKGGFSNSRAILILVCFAVTFTALALGLSYALHFYGAYMGRVREEERFKARVEHEIRTAAAIQQALLPRERVLSPRFEAAGASLPSRTIAGDFLDYFEVSGNRLAFVLGDVSGKGPPAAILAAAIQGMFFSVAESDESPAETLSRVNGALVRRAVESRFATVFHGLLTPEGRMVTCNAGHNPPLLLRRDGTTQWVTAGGLMVGIFEQATFEEESFAMTPGDALVMFSDGVTEAESTSGEMYGEERLLGTLSGASARSAAEIVSQVLDSVRAFSNGAGQADDITVLVVRYKGLVAADSRDT
jgi:serine phosphatase RsbU (regulator of sigma subunit)